LSPDEPLICVDFDDTLVHNQIHFDAALQHLETLIRNRGGRADGLAEAFAAADRLHRQVGRHRHRFLLAVLHTYARLQGTDALPLGVVEELVAIASYPYDRPPEPVPDAERALRLLRGVGRLHLVTAGDPVTQPARVQRSGLGPFFHAVHITAEKTVALYRALRGEQRVAFMIGNSPRTDILPALEAGFRTVHVQAPTWEQDRHPLPPGVPSVPSVLEAARLVAHQIGGR